MTGDVYDRRPRWRREVLRSARLGHSTKLVLLVLHEHMRADGKVSVSRATVAGELGWRYTQRVSERISDAHDAGFLVTVIEGGYGRTATWQGVFPDCVTVRESRTVTTDRRDPLTVRKTRTVRKYGFPDGYDPSNRPGIPDTITRDNPGPVPQTDMAPTSRDEPKQNCHVSHGLWSIREPWDYTLRAAS